MKQVLSVSLGSPTRNHAVRRELLGQEVEIRREGTNGDFAKAVDLYKRYDGKVDAFGVGGIEFFLRVGSRRYHWRDARQIRAAITASKVGDGNGVKGILEQRALARLEEHLNAHEGKTLKGMKALITTATERYDLAEALLNAGCDLTYGDFLFGLGLPIPLHRMSMVHILGGALLPVVTRLPYRWFYTLGEEQEKEPSVKFVKYYKRVELIAGDYLQIRTHMPNDLTGQIIVTNTTTARDVEELRKRNLHLLVTTTPRLDGRTFGTNVIEATLLALMDKPQSEVTKADFLDLIERIPLEPSIEVLN